jgi:hypothetical protein
MPVDNGGGDIWLEDDGVMVDRGDALVGVRLPRGRTIVAIPLSERCCEIFEEGKGVDKATAPV